MRRPSPTADADGPGVYTRKKYIDNVSERMNQNVGVNSMVSSFCRMTIN